MIMELVVGPLDESERADHGDPSQAEACAAGLRTVLEMVLRASRVDRLQVDWLYIGQPIPDQWAELHIGATVSAEEAVELGVGMTVGDGPYCELTGAGQVRIVPGWDGFLHAFVSSEVAAEVMRLPERRVSLQWREAAPEPAEVSDPARVAVDDDFWGLAVGDVVLLCERFAYGQYGTRWFRVSSENVELVARTVRRRSLLRLYLNPDLRPRPEVLDGSFTAFATPLRTGELVHHSYPSGADSLDEVIDAGFSALVSDSKPDGPCAVVPDVDGVVRGPWSTTD